MTVENTNTKKMKKNYKFYLRKAHRYLGFLIGVQFVFWTLGGLYFSWTNINEIRGEHLRKESGEIDFRQNFVAPQIVISELEKKSEGLKIQNLRLIEISGKPFYEFKVLQNNSPAFIVADAVSGQIRSPILAEEARKIAQESLKLPQNIKNVEYLTVENVSGHHEYREKPLPAWAVTFETNLTVYISAENGQIGAFRTSQWRVFDFLWMLHTLDFEGRDNINNYLLRGFSVFGIITILSGFWLFFASSKFFRKRFFGKLRRHSN